MDIALNEDIERIASHQGEEMNVLLRTHDGIWATTVHPDAKVTNAVCEQLSIEPTCVESITCAGLQIVEGSFADNSIEEDATLDVRVRQFDPNYTVRCTLNHLKSRLNDGGGDYGMPMINDNWRLTTGIPRLDKQLIPHSTLDTINGQPVDEWRSLNPIDELDEEDRDFLLNSEIIFGLTKPSFLAQWHRAGLDRQQIETLTSYLFLEEDTRHEYYDEFWQILDMSAENVTNLVQNLVDDVDACGDDDAMVFKILETVFTRRLDLGPFFFQNVLCDDSGSENSDDLRTKDPKYEAVIAPMKRLMQLMKVHGIR